MKIKKFDTIQYNTPHKFSNLKILNQNTYINQCIKKDNYNNIKKIEQTPNENFFNTKKIIGLGIGLAILTVGLLNHKKIGQTVKTLFPKGSEALTKPKYLYHMTSKQCYEAIAESGVIKLSRLDDAVYMFDKTNLKNTYNSESIKRMINFYDGGSMLNPSPHPASGKIFLLKIPVEKLNEDILGFRRIPLVGQDNSNISEELVNIRNYLEESSQPLINKPLEFLFKEEIPFSFVEKVHKISTKNLEKKNYIKNFFKQF